MTPSLRSGRVASGNYDAKAATYRDFGNRGVVDLVLEHLPAGGALLDIGCASGGLLAAVGAHASKKVGVELSATAAEAAREVADEVLVGSVDDDLALDPGSFDVVVCADVLEHTANPDGALQRVVQWCSSGGHVIVSVPNIAHWSARLRLLRGRWEYEPSGIFDDSHLRFFTRTTFEDLLERGGLVDVTIRPVLPALRNYVPAVTRAPKAASVEHMWQRIGRRSPGLFGYQLIGVGRKP